jgi:hypothetical protein
MDSIPMYTLSIRCSLKVGCYPITSLFADFFICQFERVRMCGYNVLKPHYLHNTIKQMNQSLL